MEFVTRLRFLILLVGIFSTNPSQAMVLMTIEQALDQVAPKDARIEKKTLFLNKVQKNQVEEKLRVELDSQMVPLIYIYDKDRNIIAKAYIDTHVVRKDTETLMVVVGENQKIHRIMVLSFNEPPEFILGDDWVSRFQTLRKEQIFQKNASVSMVLGATMTSDAIAKSVQKIIAIDELSL